MVGVGRLSTHPEATPLHTSGPGVISQCRAWEEGARQAPRHDGQPGHVDGEEEGRQEEDCI